MKAEFIKKWSNFWVFQHNANQLTEAFEKELDALTTQPHPTMSAEKQMIDFSWWLVNNLGRFSDDMQAHFNGEYLNIWRKSESLELNAIASFTPPRTEQEEADRLVELFAGIDFEDSVLRSIQVVSYHRDNLKLRGLDATFEEKVLTILKGM